MSVGIILGYLAGSLVAIGLLVLLLHVLGRSRTARLADRDAAVAIFLDEYPDASCGPAAVSRDGWAALIVLDGGARAGVVHAMGADWMTRLIRPGEVAGVRVTRAGGLRIRFTDFATPSVTVTFEALHEARAWRDWIAGFMATGAGAAPVPRDPAGGPG